MTMLITMLTLMEPVRTEPAILVLNEVDHIFRAKKRTWSGLNRGPCDLESDVNNTELSFKFSLEM